MPQVTWWSGLPPKTTQKISFLPVRSWPPTAQPWPSSQFSWHPSREVRIGMRRRPKHFIAPCWPLGPTVCSFPVQRIQWLSGTSKLPFKVPKLGMKESLRPLKVLRQNSPGRRNSDGRDIIRLPCERSCGKHRRPFSPTSRRRTPTWQRGMMESVTTALWGSLGPTPLAVFSSADIPDLGMWLSKPSRRHPSRTFLIWQRWERELSILMGVLDHPNVLEILSCLHGAKLGMPFSACHHVLAI